MTDLMTQMTRMWKQCLEGGTKPRYIRSSPEMAARLRWYFAKRRNPRMRYQRAPIDRVAMHHMQRCRKRRRFVRINRQPASGWWRP